MLLYTIDSCLKTVCKPLLFCEEIDGEGQTKQMLQHRSYATIAILNFPALCPIYIPYISKVELDATNLSEFISGPQITAIPLE